MTIYALYKGDEFIDVGTAKEIAERQELKPKFIRWLACCKRQREEAEKGANCLIAVVVERIRKRG